MAIENLDDILITGAEKEKVRKNSPFALPLNSTAQGWSAQKIREKLYRAICSETGALDDNILDILVNKLQKIKVVFDDIDDGTIIVKKAEEDSNGNNIIATYSTKTELATLESNIEDGTITAYKATCDGDGLIIASNYGVSLSLSYDENTNKITILLHSSDNTLLDTKYIALPNATQSASGLMSSTDKSRLDILHALLGVTAGDADTIVNKIREVLDIFENYPEGDILLDVLATKATKEELAILESNIDIDGIFADLVDGTITVLKAERDSEGNIIKSNYGSSITFDYDESTRVLTLKLFAKDGSQLGSDLTITLPLANATDDGLMSSSDKVKLTDLPTNTQLDSALAVKVPQTRTILGIDLSDDITLNEVKNAIGEATDSLSGLMSSTDKSRLDILHALLGVEGSADDFVNTINEILAIFSAYPEGFDLVSALAGKVDKVTGYGLSENDFTDTLKTKLTDLPTNTQLDSALAVKVPQTRTILGIDLSDDILLAEFKNAIGEATDSLSGLMSSTDKSRLNALHNLLEEDTSNSVVDSINEILSIFNNYPEGADLVSALAGKVDKVTGYGLSENDFTDTLKTKLTDLPTNTQLDSALAVKVPQTRTILGIDLSDDILLAEFKTAIGEATTLLSGLMSSTDKSRLDALHALLGVESDADAVVNTINEVLAIFSAYPEGADLVNALAGKVDKVTGYGLSENDFTDVLKAKLDSLSSDSTYYDKTYTDLVALRYDGDLIPGAQYRITDYITTTSQTDTQSAGHQFDIIVVADDVDKLNENARAVQHEGDTYFANSKLESWKLKYCLDNDTSRFAWADSVNGKGVIYRMIDEFNNDVPYDFKNIQFKRKLTDGVHVPVLGNDTWVYTFTMSDLIANKVVDISLKQNTEYQDTEAQYIQCSDNVIKEAIIENGLDGVIKVKLNDNVFLNVYDNNEDFFYYGCYSNTFANNCYSNTFGNGCYFNTFGHDCYSNKFGNRCYSNTFANNCSNNTLGNNFYYNNFGGYCKNNVFGSGCYSNTFGDGCYGNNLTNGCHSNTFANSCYSNTFANNCYSNTFGNSCYSNAFDYDCQLNTFGDYCSTNHFGRGCFSNTFGNSCQYLKISDDTSTLKQYISVENGTQGASSANKFDLYDSAILNKDYQVTFKKDADGRYAMTWLDDYDKLEGKYKNNNLDDEWKNLPHSGISISIVDDLTTDDATKVLSAKQGKVLQDTKVSKVTTAGLSAYTKNGTTQSTMNIVNTAPTASTLVQRDANGRIKASAGVANNDVVTVGQLNDALGDIDSALDAILGV